MATELVLFRHFAAAKGMLEVTIASDHPDVLHRPGAIPIYPHPLLLRLTKTRLAPFAHSLRHWPITFDCRALQTYLQCNRPDAILTVAHGELYSLAQQISQRYKLPLVTFFHDWLPDMAWVHEQFRPFLTRRFRQLYRQSHVAFCVSEAMQQHLGEHPHSQVLFPIPGDLETSETLPFHPPFSSFRLTYAGNLSDCYGPFIQQLGVALRAHPTIQLQCFGQAPNWPAASIQQFQDWGIYQGFVSRSTLLQHLLQSHALLVVMSFESHLRQRMETSFPSKLIEYCQLGKPLLIWGPEYSTAVQWAKRYAAAEVVTTPTANAVVKVLQQLSQNPEKQEQLAKRARQLATEFFNPLQIQQQFLDGLRIASQTVQGAQ